MLAPTTIPPETRAVSNIVGVVYKASKASSTASSNASKASSKASNARYLYVYPYIERAIYILYISMLCGYQGWVGFSDFDNVLPAPRRPLLIDLPTTD